jgi:toxin HigB-1
MGGVRNKLTPKVNNLLDISQSIGYNSGGWMKFRFKNRNLCRFYLEFGFLWGYTDAIKRAFVKRILSIEAASSINDLRKYKGSRLEKLSGVRKGQYSMRINDQYRLILIFIKENADDVVEIMEITDYH